MRAGAARSAPSPGRRLCLTARRARPAPWEDQFLGCGAVVPSCAPADDCPARARAPTVDLVRYVRHASAAPIAIATSTTATITHRIRTAASSLPALRGGGT